MAIAIRASPTTGTTATNQTTHTVTKPPGTTDGDLLVTLFGCDLSTNTIVTPSGWTRTPLTQQLPGPAAGAVDRKIASSEPASTNWVLSIGERAAWIAMAISGTDGTTTFNATAQDATQRSDSMPFPTVTTTVDNCLILYLCVLDYGTAETFATDPTGCTRIEFAAISSGATVVGWYETKATAGLTTTRTADGTAANETAALWTLAIAPAATGKAIPVRSRNRSMRQLLVR